MSVVTPGSSHVTFPRSLPVSVKLIRALRHLQYNSTKGGRVTADMLHRLLQYLPCDTTPVSFGHMVANAGHNGFIILSSGLGGVEIFDHCTYL